MITQAEIDRTLSNCPALVKSLTEADAMVARTIHGKCQFCADAVSVAVAAGVEMPAEVVFSCSPCIQRRFQVDLYHRHVLATEAAATTLKALCEVLVELAYTRFGTSWMAKWKARWARKPVAA